ncbi:hypothetical protein JL722_4420 [Aureococcus anophagefferens]|nr:hypothetical protein JL722_4420 [Aureococcus anophagefferens]
MQRDVDRVRHAIHDRAGPASLEAAARALPTHVDTKFCGDAVTAVHMLIFAVPSLAEPFFRSLHSDEKRHVDFIKNVSEKRNLAARELWKDYIDGLQLDVGVRSWSKLEWCVEECDSLVQGLAITALPRFLHSELYDDWQEAAEALEPQDPGGDVAAALLSTLGRLRRRLPANMEAWLGVLVSMAETLQLCVAVSDMAAPGAPMVYVNGEFCRMTGYAFDECVGRNCRFLQGPETETDAVEILRESLAARKGAHVVIKNYRKNQEPFRNLLTMTPVYDGDGCYRFVIAVQFELRAGREASAMAQRRELASLGRLLQSLPVKVRYKSAEWARNYGLRAPETSSAAFLEKRRQSLERAQGREGHDGHPTHFAKRVNYFCAGLAALLRNVLFAADGALRLLATATPKSKLLDHRDGHSGHRDDPEPPVHASSLGDDDLACFALFCDEVRRDFWDARATEQQLAVALAREKRPSRIRKKSSGDVACVDDAVEWAADLFSPRAPAGPAPGGTRSARHSRTAAAAGSYSPPAPICAPMSRALSVGSSGRGPRPSYAAPEQPLWAAGRTLAESCRDHVAKLLLESGRRAFVEKSIRATKACVQECLVDLVLAPLLASKVGLEIIQELCDADVAARLARDDGRADGRGVRGDSLTTLYCYDRSGDRFKCMVVLVTLRDALGEPAYTLGFQVRVTNDADKLGKALLAVDATLRRLPRSTSAADAAWVNVGAADALERAPLALACWLTVEGFRARDDRAKGGARWVATLDAVLDGAKPRRALLKWAEAAEDCTIVARGLLRFVLDVDAALACKERQDKIDKLRELLLRMHGNALYYFSSLEIPMGSMARMNLDQALDLVAERRRALYPYLAKALLPSFLGEDAAVGSHPDVLFRTPTLEDTASLLLGNRPSELGLLDVALDDAPLAVLLVDRELKVRFANGRFRDLADRERRDVADFVPTALHACLREGWPGKRVLLPRATTDGADASAEEACAPGLCLCQPAAAVPDLSAVLLCGLDPETLRDDLHVASTLCGLLAAPPSRHAADRRLEAARAERRHAAGDVELSWAKVSNRKLDRHLKEADNSAVPLQARFGGNAGLLAANALTTSLANSHRVTATGAKSPRLMDAGLADRDSRRKWCSYGYEKQRKLLFTAMADVKAEGDKALIQQYEDDLLSAQDLSTLLDSHRHEVKELHPDMVEHGRLTRELEHVRTRSARAKLALKKKQDWEVNNMTRKHERERDDMQQRHLDEAQTFIDKVAENFTRNDGTAAGAISKQKFVRCACKNPYICRHNRNALCVVETPGVETAAGLPPKRDNEVRHNARVVEAMLAQHTNAREALESKQGAARETALERMRIAERVMGQKFKALTTKCEQRVARCEGRLLVARQRGRVYRLPGMEDDDPALRKKQSPHAAHQQAIVTHYVNKHKTAVQHSRNY